MRSGLPAVMRFACLRQDFDMMAGTLILRCCSA